MWFFKLPQYQNEYILQHNAMICEDDDYENETMTLFISSRFLAAGFLENA